MSSNFVSGKKIADVMSAEVSARARFLNLTIFASFPDHNLQKISTD